HRAGCRPARHRPRRPLGRPPRSDGRERRPGAVQERRRRRVAPGERSLPRAADAAGPRARGRRCRDRTRHGLQSRERVLRKPAARLLARGHAAAPLARRGALGLHGERRARPRTRGSKGPSRPRLRRGRPPPGRARLAVPRVPPGRRTGANRARGRPPQRATLVLMATKKQRRRQQKLRRHEWEEVWVDEEGREVEVDEPPAPAKPRKAESAKARPAQRGGGRRVVRPAPPPSWRRVAKRGAILAPLFFVAVFYLQKQGDRNVATAALTTVWMMGL